MTGPLFIQGVSARYKATLYEIFIRRANAHFMSFNLSTVAKFKLSPPQLIYGRQTDGDRNQPIPFSGSRNTQL